MEPLGPGLLSLHNVHYYQELMEDSRQAITADNFAAFAKSKLDAIDRHEHSARRLGQEPARGAS